MMIFDELKHDDEDQLFSAIDRAKAASNSTWCSVIVNISLSILQIFLGIFSKSQGLVADGIHSFSDLVADFIVLFASHHSKKEADLDHQFGHQRFENAASLILGLILLLVGIGMLISAFNKIQNPASIEKVHIIALWVAGTALIAKELLFRYMLSVAKQVKSSMLVANAWHARSDALSSLVVGIGIIGNLMGYPILDPIAAALVGLMIVKMGWQFGWVALNDLMDKAADVEEVEAITKTLLETKGVSGIHDVRTRKMGDMILVDAHIEVEATLTVEEGHHIAVEARKRVLQHHRVLNLMTHVDPYQRPDFDHS
jgi:cation diffusion facilitator family transporter